MSKLDSKLKDKLQESNFVNKIKNIKHLDIVIVIIFVSILLLIYFGDSSNKSNENNGLQNYTSYEAYTKDLETRLSKVLSKIEGVGDINVMITLDGSPELIIAYNTEEKINNSLSTNESVTIKKEPIIITQDGSSNPLILSEKLPSILGVVIVAQGANNVAVKLNLLSATTKLLNISVNSIEIFAGN